MYKEEWKCLYDEAVQTEQEIVYIREQLRRMELRTLRFQNIFYAEGLRSESVAKKGGDE